MRKLIAVVAAAGALGLGATAAFAGNSPSPSTSSSTTNSVSSQAASTGRRHPRLARQAVAVSAKTIGIAPKQLVKELVGGKSIGDVAKAHHVDPSKVTGALVVAGSKDVKAALDAGKITKERAAKIVANLPKRAAAFVAKVRHPGKALERRRARGALAVAAKTIGVDLKGLVGEIRSGKTVADVATAHNVAPQKVIDAVVAAGSKRIDKAVANNKLTPERASALKSSLVKRVTKLVNDTPHPGQDRAAAS